MYIYIYITLHDITLHLHYTHTRARKHTHTYIIIYIYIYTHQDYVTGFPHTSCPEKDWHGLTVDFAKSLANENSHQLVMCENWSISRIEMLNINQTNRKAL